MRGGGAETGRSEADDYTKSQFLSFGSVQSEAIRLVARSIFLFAVVTRQLIYGFIVPRRWGYRDGGGTGCVVLVS